MSLDPSLLQGWLRRPRQGAGQEQPRQVRRGVGGAGGASPIACVFLTLGLLLFIGGPATFFHTVADRLPAADMHFALRDDKDRDRRRGGGGRSRSPSPDRDRERRRRDRSPLEDRDRNRDRGERDGASKRPPAVAVGGGGGGKGKGVDLDDPEIIAANAERAKLGLKPLR